MISIQTDPLPDFSQIAVSPRGDRVAVAQLEADGAQHIWVKQLSRGSWQRLTFEGTNRDPAWTPDGERVIFSSRRSGNSDIYIKPADGSEDAQVVLDEPTDVSDPIMSPDNQWLIYTRAANIGTDVMAKKLGTGDDPVPVAVMPGVAEFRPALSPNGKWLAYGSQETGRNEIWVRAFPAGQPKRQISDDGGNLPRWGRSGRELLYRFGAGPTRGLVSVPVGTENAFTWGQDSVLFLFGDDDGWWDVGADDQSYLLVRSRSPAVASTVIAVDNFFEEVLRRVGR